MFQIYIWQIVMTLDRKTSGSEFLERISHLTIFSTREILHSQNFLVLPIIVMHLCLRFFSPTDSH